MLLIQNATNDWTKSWLFLPALYRKSAKLLVRKQSTFSYRDRKISEYSVREPWRRGYYLYASALLGASTTLTTPRVWHSITHSTRNCWRVDVILLFTTLKTTPALLWNYAGEVRFLLENFDMKMSIVRNARIYNKLMLYETRALQQAYAAQTGLR